ncbi:MAG: hypothetical protein NC217_01120 [Muribaculaceae bacterium]|nr:hypothetical protein [Muribaculaceae bacterium]
MKKKEPKKIPHPELQSAKRLTPLQLNAMRWDNKHTVLTPEIIRQYSRTSTTK